MSHSENPDGGDGAEEPKNASTEAGEPSGLKGCRGWHSRRYMPHVDSSALIQHVTFHLADSLPQSALDRMMAELEAFDPDKREVQRRRRLEALIDAGYGSCILGRPTVAHLVQSALLHFDGVRYRLLAWVVMPNHVHALFQTMDDWKVSRVVASWKSWSGKHIADILSREAPTAAVGEPTVARSRVWHREYWDRFIRDESHLSAATAYIHQNPVKAGLVERQEDWPWSSAHPSSASS